MRMRRLRFASALGLAAACWAPAGTAADAGATGNSSDAGADGSPTTHDAGPPRDAGGVHSACVESVPEGKERPSMSETISRQGTSGYAAWLELVVEHGKGETVLPSGFRFQLTGDDARAIERAGFVLPDPDGGAGPSKVTEEAGGRAKTTVRIAFVPLPEEPGRQELVLPPLPIAIERASGELIRLCTKPHVLTIEDPIANTPNAEPKQNPPPRRQLEEWTTAKHVAYAALAALLIGALVALLIDRWRRRPKPEPPPPPPIPPWVVALEELHAIRHAGLIADGRTGEHFDRVSDAVRRYLGDRYGFDGLESTTREILGVLERIVPKIPIIPEIEAFLRHADLVKFARLTPTETECEEALDSGERIVHRTIPPEPNRPPRPAAPAASDDDDDEPAPVREQPVAEPATARDPKKADDDGKGEA